MYIDKAYVLKHIKQGELDKLCKEEDGTVNYDYLDQAISTADSFVNGYLKKVITTLPLTSAPDSIKQCSYNIALYNLHDRIQYMDIPEWVTKKYEGTMKFLKDISNGNADISDLPEDVKNSEIYFESVKPVFGRDSF